MLCCGDTASLKASNKDRKNPGVDQSIYRRVSIAGQKFPGGLHCGQLGGWLCALSALDNLLQGGCGQRLPPVFVICCVLVRGLVVNKITMHTHTSVRGTFRFLFNVSSLFVFLISTVTWKIEIKLIGHALCLSPGHLVPPSPHLILRLALVLELGSARCRGGRLLLVAHPQAAAGLSGSLH